MATRKTVAKKPAATTATPKKKNKFVKGAQGRSLPKVLREHGRDNDLVLVHLTLANDIQGLTIMGAIEIYDHDDYEFQMYRKEFEYMRDHLLEDRLELITESFDKAKRQQERVNSKLDKGIIGNRQASMEMQSCNGPAFFYQETGRGMKPIRYIELVKELGPENTAENEREALIKKLSVTV